MTVQDNAEPSEHERLRDAVVSRVIHDFEEHHAFDAIEIARALLAVAFQRVEEIEGPEVAVSYYRHLQGCSERYLERRHAFIDAWARSYVAEREALDEEVQS